MKRLTTDNPQSNLERLLNYAFAENGWAVLRYVDGQGNVDLCKYISEHAGRVGCKVTTEAVRDGSCLECLGCDCPLATLYAVATQAAELRARLKQYEDTGKSPEDVVAMDKKLTELQAFVQNWHEECGLDG